MLDSATRFMGKVTYLVSIAVIVAPLISQAATTAQKSSPGIGFGFEKKGTVEKVYVRVGDTVYIGQPLIDLDKSELLAQLHLAQANVQIEKAKLEQIKNPDALGGSVKLQNAKRTLENIKLDLITDVLPDVYTKANDAVRNKVDQFFIGLRSLNPQTSFRVDDIRLQSDLSAKRFTVERLLTSWKMLVDSMQLSGDIHSYASIARANVSQVNDFLDTVVLGLNLLQPDLTITLTTIRNYRTDVSAALVSVNTALKNLVSAENKLRDAEASYGIESTGENPVKNSSALLLQGGHEKAAEAKVEIVQAALKKMTLRAPMSGIITKELVRVGSVVSGPALVIYIGPNTKR